MVNAPMASPPQTLPVHSQRLQPVHLANSLLSNPIKPVGLLPLRVEPVNRLERHHGQQDETSPPQ
jgi:hypothetical protein